MDAYIYMSYDNMLRVFEYNSLKIISPFECNDPFEFLPSCSDLYHRGSNEIGFLCFSGTFEQPTMWSHYAQRHQGCCLHFQFSYIEEVYNRGPEKDHQITTMHDGYLLNLSLPQRTNVFDNQKVNNRTSLKKSDAPPIIWRVSYDVPRWPDIGKIMDVSYDEKGQAFYYWNPIFITKGPSWKYEDEMRILLMLSEDQKKNPFIKGFNKYIKDVYLGWLCPHSVQVTQNALDTAIREIKNNGEEGPDSVTVKKVFPHPIGYLLQLNKWEYENGKATWRES